MIEKIEISGNNGYRIEEPFKKYIKKRLSKLDKYLPRNAKKDVVCRVVIAEIGKNKADKFSVAVTMDLTGGKVIAAKDECSNVFTGIDLVEAKLTGQIRRYKLEVQPHRQKKSWRKFFVRKK